MSAAEDPGSRSATAPTRTASEVVEYSCRRCGHRWTREYEVTWHDYWDGYRIEIYRERGTPCPPPDNPMPCPRCGGLRVRTARTRRAGPRIEPAI